VSFALQIRFRSCDECVCVSNLVIKLQIHSMYSSRFENEVFIHKTVGGVGEITSEVHMSITCSVFDVENVQLEFGITFHHKMMFNL
jgi:hypothetical protein